MSPYTLSDPAIIVDDPNYRRHVRMLKKDNADVGTIDLGIADLVTILCNKGYETTYSCSGLLRDHWVIDDWIDEEYVKYVMSEAKISYEVAATHYLKGLFHRCGYIYFKNPQTFALPEGLVWSQQGIYHANSMVPERDKVKQWDELKIVVEKLPNVNG